MKLFLSLGNSADNAELLKVINRNLQITLTDTIEDNTYVLVNGPLTELSDMLIRDYTLADKIEKILLVGGSDSYGDVTPVAEKNIYDDPESAQHVFLSGIPIVMFGLNVTRELKNRSLMPLAWLFKPQIFKTDECGVFVETKGKKTRGMTVTDVYSDKQFDKHFVEIVLDFDWDQYRDLLKHM